MAPKTSLSTVFPAELKDTDSELKRKGYLGVGYTLVPGTRKKVWHGLLSRQLTSEEMMAILACDFGDEVGAVRVLLEVLLVEEKNIPTPRYKLEQVVAHVERAGRFVRRDFDSVLSRVNSALGQAKLNTAPCGEKLLARVHYVDYDPRQKTSRKLPREYRIVMMRPDPDLAKKK